jgi:hypothetical protein
MALICYTEFQLEVRLIIKIRDDYWASAGAFFNKLSY